jgi:hypothetical protein
MVQGLGFSLLLHMGGIRHRGLMLKSCIDAAGFRV